VARRAAPMAALVTIAFLVWTVVNESDRTGVEWLVVVLAAITAGLLVVAPGLIAAGRAGLAFAVSAVAIAMLFVALFVDLFPHTMVSSISPRYDMTLNVSASSHYTLSVMTVVAVILIPVVLLYQGWTYWVFRKRLSAEDFAPTRNPIDAVRGSGPAVEG
jgi:cytochrome bd ubiquinol oxidase subunit II